MREKGGYAVGAIGVNADDAGQIGYQAGDSALPERVVNTRDAAAI